jgi:DNA-directed RNA polymerase
MSATLRGPTQIMAWLKNGAGLAAKAGSPISWTTPAGFPVVQNMVTKVERKLRTVFREQIIWVSYKDKTDKLDTAYAKTGTVPNYVHSLDAAAIHNTAARAEIEQIASNHDSIGAVPADMAALCSAFLDEFATMYEREYPLLAMYEFFKKRVKEKDLKHLKPPPPQGTLDVSAIRNSRYAMN